MRVSTLLSDHGILGLNARNLLYIKPYNPKKAVAFADDKLKTKAFLAARGVPAAKIFARIESRKQLRTFDFSQVPDECVLKPNYGFGGEGIFILKGRDAEGRFLEQGKRPIPERELHDHIEDILDGKFSVNGRADTAFFEKILVADPCFAPFRPAGLPDIRIVVFNLVPVMAMLRIPTAQSRGKANVHLGGIGIGIDLAKGATTHAVQYNRIIHELPHGGSPAGYAIPRWDEILLIASRIQSITNIGYLAVDLTLDEELGPALLEVNARAGLMVQLANLAPLRARLERVSGIVVSSPEKGVRLAQDLFGEAVRKRMRAAGDDAKPVLSTTETIAIAGEGLTMEVPALIAPQEDRTTFAAPLVEELRAKGMAEPEEGAYRVKFLLAGRKIQTVVRAGAVPAGAQALIGRRDLQGFLIDPAKTAPATRAAMREDLRAIDGFLAEVDHAFLLLKYLKPENLEEERARLAADAAYNPLFQYLELPADVADVERRLQAISPDDSPLGVLLGKKRRELLLRLKLLRARGRGAEFTDASLALFGHPTTILVTAARAALAARVACEMPVPDTAMLDAAAVAVRFEETLKRYGLHEWRIAVRPGIVADCTVGGTTIYIREGARFSPAHVEALLAHEIETHVLTSENGDQQPFELLRRGMANYLDTQEGLAIVNQNRVLPAYHDKRYTPAANVLAVGFALDHSFAETRAYLARELGYMPERALAKTIGLKRGIADTSEPGAFTKGIVYFRGARAVEAFIAGGGDLRRLYVGKIALDDLDLVEKISGLKPPLVLPEFLRPAPKTPRKKRA